jgi:hypothetical protein
MKETNANEQHATTKQDSTQQQLALQHFVKAMKDLSCRLREHCSCSLHLHLRRLHVLDFSLAPDLRRVAGAGAADGGTAARFDCALLEARLFCHQWGIQGHHDWADETASDEAAIPAARAIDTSIDVTHDEARDDPALEEQHGASWLSSDIEEAG